MSDLVSLPNNDLVVATNGSGVYLFKEGILKKHWTSKTNELKSNNCTKLLYDNYQLWILSNKGIDCVKFDSTDFEKYAFLTQYDHLSFSTSINDLAVTNGQVLVATSEGIYRFSPEQLAPYAAPPLFEIQTKITKKEGILHTRDTVLKTTTQQALEFLF